MEMKANFGLKFNNFNPDDVQTEETINAVFVLDVSPSMDQDDAIKSLNKAYNEFVQEMQMSHIKDRLMVSNVKFCETVEVVHGFRPIMDIQPLDLNTEGRGTALYSAVKAALDNAIDYRKNLEDTGVTCKTLLFVITDGEDNSSGTRPSEIKDAIKDILKDEKNAFSFTSILFGVGNQSNFKYAQEQMGIQNLAEVGYSAKDIRKMINFISSSISSSASGKQVSTTNF